MRWSEDVTLKFVKIYLKHEPLWNPEHPHYKIRYEREKAYREIVSEFRAVKNVSVPEVKIKIKHLRTTYAQQVTKILKRSSPSSMYEPTLVWFHEMDRCLKYVHNSRHPSSSRATDKASDGEQCDVVAREEFLIEVRKYYSSQSENTKKPEWTLKRLQQVINLIEDFKSKKRNKQKYTNQQHHYASKYDVLDVSGEKILIVKQKNTSSPVRQIIASENYYDILFAAHVATGHGGRDKIIHALKEQFLVPQFAIKIFLGLCKICTNKRNFPKTDSIRQPLVRNDFNRKGQIELIDLQSAPDGDYKWLLNYQDHLTKFCFLRPLKSKSARQVALELLKIFLEVGCPHILQSNDGREFTADVIKELMTLWPTCKILNGRPQHSQSQGSSEYCNQDVEQMMRAWMTNNSSTNWSVGCYFVQFQINSSSHRTIDRTPYRALFGHEPTIGLTFGNLPIDVIETLENEEDLEKVLCHEKRNNDNVDNGDDVDEEKNATQEQAKIISTWQNNSRQGLENDKNAEASMECNMIQEHVNVNTLVVKKERDSVEDVLHKEEPHIIISVGKTAVPSLNIEAKEPFIRTPDMNGSQRESRRTPEVDSSCQIWLDQEMEDAEPINPDPLVPATDTDAETSLQEEPSYSKASSPPRKKTKKKIKKESAYTFTDSNTNSETTLREDEFDIYGKFIASQLRQMELHKALRLQVKIQTLVSEARISEIV